MELTNKRLKTDELPPHEALHNALKNSKLTEVKKLLKLGIKLCHENTDENCYILAQQNKKLTFLATLLEYDPRGIETIDSNGDSLLIRDIRDFECRHFKLLIDKGADVNYSNDSECAALHYATMNKNTTLSVIKKLIELKADVNKKLQFNNSDNYVDFNRNDLPYDDNNGDTPLICLIKNYGEKTFEKVKLLIESGADVNLTNTIERTPLIYAANINIAKLKLLKYLIEKGAKAGVKDLHNCNAIHSLVFSIRNAGLCEENQNLISEYIIPAIHLLHKSGDDLFLRNWEGSSPLCYLCHLFFVCQYVNRIVVYLVKLGFYQLTTGCKIISLNQCHPLTTILSNFYWIKQHDIGVFKQIADLILNHPTDEFKNFPSVQTFLINCFQWNCISGNDWDLGVSVVGSFTIQAPLNQIKDWLIKLKHHNFNFESEYPLFVILLKRFIEAETPTTPEGLLDVIDYLLQISYPIYSEKIDFSNENLQTLRTVMKVPDCIWFSAVFGNIDCLKKFLPHWNQHPVTILLLLRPWLEKEERLQHLMLRSIEIILPYLIECGGPIEKDSTLHALLKRYTNEYILEGILRNKFNCNPQIGAIYSRIFHSLTNLSDTDPVNLQIYLNRAIIMEHSTKNDLSPMVPAYELENFLYLLENSQNNH